MPTPLELNPAHSSEKIAIYCQEHGCESLTKSSLEALSSQLSKEWARLSRFNAMKIKFTREDEASFHELQFTMPLVRALALKATSGVSSVHDLLAQCDMSKESEVVSKIAVTVWVHRLQDLLEREPCPLALFVMMRDLLLDSPVIFCAALHYLFAQSIAIDDIIQSGLLHEYFVGHTFAMRKVEQVYLFLAKNYWGQNAIPAFLEKISKISTLDTGLKNYSLNGTLKKEEDVLELVRIVDLNYPWMIDEAYFDKLFQFFGFSFLVATLQQLYSVPDTRLKAILVSKLGAFSIDDVEQLYGYVYRSVPAAYRQVLFSEINPYFTDEMISKLLESKAVSVWNILSSKPSLVSELDIGWLKSKILSLKASEIEQAFDLSQSKPFQNQQLDSLIYLRIAELLLEQPGLFIESEIYSKLLVDDAVQAWLKDKAQEYLVTMKEAMDCLRLGFTEERYDILCDFMRFTQSSYQALQKMSHTKLDLPINNHQRDGSILAYYYLLSISPLSVEHVNDVLAIMQKFSRDFDSEELGLWKGRILLAAILTSCITDDLRNFLWKESAYLGLWKQTLTAKNLGRVLMPLADELFKTGLTSISNEIENSIKNASDLGLILSHLNEWQCKQFLDAVQGKLSDVIKDGEQLHNALELLNETQRDVLLGAVKGQLIDIIKDGIQLGRVLYCLNKRQCAVLIGVVKGQLSYIIEDGEQLHNALKYLNETQRDVLLSVVQGQLRGIIKDGIQLGRVLCCLNKMQCVVLLSAVKGQLSYIIKDGKQLHNALTFLNGTQRDVLFGAVQGQLMDIIKDGNQLGRVLCCLNKRQCDVLLGAIKGQLSNILKDYEELYNALKPLDEAQRNVLFGAVKHLLMGIIKDGEQLGVILWYLNGTQCDALFAAVQGQLSNIIYDSSQLGYALCFLNKVQCGVLLGAVQNKLTDIIKNDDELNNVLTSLNDEQRGLLLDVVQGELSHLIKTIKSGAQLCDALGALNEAQRYVLFGAFQSKLRDIINDSEQLGKILKHLNETQCDILLDEVQYNLSTIIHSGKALTDVLIQTESRHFMPLLKRIENDLPNIILTVDELDAVIDALNNNQTEINMVLEAMKGRLPSLIKSTSELKSAHLSMVLKENQGNMFFSKRATTINVGSFERKLIKYIESREKEWSFHWNFLGLKTFIYYFCGDMSLIKHRDIKIAAAQYLLDIVQNKPPAGPLTDVMKKSLNECLLGAIVEGQGGVDSVLAEFDPSNIRRP